MQYQIQNPEGFSRMLETIIETDRLQELAFAMWYRGKDVYKRQVLWSDRQYKGSEELSSADKMVIV